MKTLTKDKNSMVNNPVNFCLFVFSCLYVPDEDSKSKRRPLV